MHFKAAAVFIVAIVFSKECCAQMIRNDHLQQDQAKLSLCIDRSRHDRSFGIGLVNEDLIPFEIDMSFVEGIREKNPEATFFATARSLTECEVTGIGKYGPLVRYSGPSRIWRPLTPDVTSFQPSVETGPGKRIVVNKCLADLPTHADLANFDHAGYNEPYSVGYLGSHSAGGPNHPSIAGIPVSSNDVMVTGAAYFKTRTIDQIMLLYTCLYSPMLELKAVGWRKSLPGRQIWLKSARQAAAQINNNERHR